MLSSKFIGSGKRLPCPVCGRDKDDKCRIGDDGRLILCGSEVNGRKPKDTYNGFVYLGLSENEVWGRWVPINDDWVKDRPSAVQFRYPFYDKDGNKIVEEVRTYDGQSKKRTWMDPKGVNTSILLPYRYDEAIAALKNGAEQVLILEGPPKADMAWELGIPAVAFANGFKPSRDKHWFQGFEGRIVLVPDQDLPGLKKLEGMQAAYPMAKQWRPWPDSARWEPEWISDKGGLDFLDWVQQLKGQGYGDEEIAALVKPETNGHLFDGGVAIAVEVAEGEMHGFDLGDETDDGEQGFNQKAHNALYKFNKWVCFSNVLYIWQGSYYKMQSDDDEIPRIQVFCENYVELKILGTGKNKREVLTYPYATPRAVLDVLKWVKMKYTVDMRYINPPGINCKNGVVEISWQGKKLHTTLIKHDPLKHYYICEPSIKYNPKADSTEYDRMMQCLEPGAQDIWEKTIAASIDLATVRKYGSRTVKALFLKGDGSNGKDSLKRITQILFGRGALSACSCTDWKQYDEGRYFTINALHGKRINWPSENADAGRIDQLQGLKSAITGDEIIFEAKGRDPKQGEPQAVFLFNVNENPQLLTHLKATESRWALVPFDKTYSSNPDVGELKADPRFKEDPDFLKDKVIPAFLNKLLLQLQSVVEDGIDYSSTKDAMQQLQMQNCHILQFAADSGLQYVQGASVTPMEIWERLKQWYIDNSILTVEHIYSKTDSKEKLLWTLQANRDDENVKAPHQVLKRFLDVFPKAKKGTYPDANRNQKPIILGLGFVCTNEQNFSVETSDDYLEDCLQS